MAMLPRPIVLSRLLSLSQRTTASLTPITWLSLLRRSSLSARAFLKPASPMKGSRTRNGPTPSLLLRKKRKTSSLVLEERLSASANASRSNCSRLINVLSKLLSVVEVDSAVAEAVAMDLLEVAEAMVDSVADAVVKAEEVAHVVAITEAVVVLLAQEAAQQLLLLTLKTPAPSPAWDHRSRPNVSHDLHLTGANFTMRLYERMIEQKCQLGATGEFFRKMDGFAKVYGG